ncbi:hypothetical protein EV681_4496 [Advenella incenata]|uniref:TnsA endonuclease-like protein n=1 Tax=Advenella incenata TaxID=267800 RepID=A0A4Q7V5C4_9BURK|nr:hypothetical protein [Advenella incenata]RZT91736.1 hypothetical protein EV681_4496 [Advenella incenata]
MKQVRKLVHRSPHRRVGYVVCTYVQPEPIEYESRLERDFVRIALLHPSIRRIVAQPTQIEIPGFGGYTPDYFLLDKNENKYIVEVKSSVFVDKYAEKLPAAKHEFDQIGMKFILTTDQQIEPRKQFAGLVHRYSQSYYSSSAIAEVIEKIHSLRLPAPINEIVRRLGIPIELIYYLIGHRYLQIDACNENGLILDEKGQENGEISIERWIGVAAR